MMSLLLRGYTSCSDDDVGRATTKDMRRNRVRATGQTERDGKGLLLLQSFRFKT